jgi:hypothetical protein
MRDLGGREEECRREEESWDEREEGEEDKTTVTGAPLAKVTSWVDWLVLQGQMRGRSA